MNTHSDVPYISVVMAARNDNHGENMLGRIQASLYSWICLAQRYGMRSEIVIVEWNPPKDRSPLKDALQLPSDTSLCDIRFVTVPPELHTAIPYASAIHLHQMIAKNVGIRRAHGQFVLATNIDIIFSAELMRFFAERRLERGKFYRMDRYDIASNIPAGTTVDELLRFCGRNIQRVSAREGTWSTNGDNLRPVEPGDIVTAESGIHLGAGWYGLETGDGSPKRYLGSEAEVALTQPDTADLFLDVETGPSARDGQAELVVFDADGVEVAAATITGRAKLRLTLPDGFRFGRIRLATRHDGVPLLQDPRLLNLRVFGISWRDIEWPSSAPPRAEDSAPETGGRSGWRLSVIGTRPGVNWIGVTPGQSPHAASMRNAAYLHTNACGDFTMLSREDWNTVRAYPEFPIWPMHIDALLCYAAHHAGIREVILRDPLRIFHIQHLSASGATPEGEEELQARVARKNVPIIDYPSLLNYFNHMRRFDVPLIFSGENWGLAGEALPDTTLAGKNASQPVN
jgi:hypothetical protein